MANRRMVSNGIVKSARFLKMPPSTQNLYFHLIMNADDDGVVEAFPIMRMVGATEDDLKLLEGNELIIISENNIRVIEEWEAISSFKQRRLNYGL